MGTPCSIAASLISSPVGECTLSSTGLSLTEMEKASFASSCSGLVDVLVI